MTVGTCTDTGKVREINEDAFVARPDIGLFAVADGMGGHAAGEVASRLAIDALTHALEHSTAAPETQLHQAFETAHQAVWDEARRNGSNMGTTLTAALVQGRQVTIGHVGDSRAYLVNADGVKQLTDDHSLVAQMVREGQLTSEEAEHHPRKHVLTQALGTTAALHVDVFTVPLPPDAALLLCSDGLSNLVTSDEIAKIVHHTADPQQAAQRLVDIANRRGGTDNITAVVVKPTEVKPLISPRLRTPFKVLLVVALLLTVGTLAGQRYLDRSFYLGAMEGRVVIFRGVPLHIGSYLLSRPEVVTKWRVEDILPAYQQRIQEGIIVRDLVHAKERLTSLVAPKPELKPEPKPKTKPKPKRPVTSNQ